MTKIMKVIPEKVTNKWFTSLPAKDRVKVKELQQAREGITNGHQKRIPAMPWWFQQGWVRKSEVYKMYHTKFKSKGDKKPLSKTKEVKENGK